MKRKKGRFITLEGPEGSGKTTQAKLLYAYLKKKGYRCVLTREPGGTDLGENIRKILLSPSSGRISDVCETLLFETSRAALVRQALLPRLSEGAIVICDRYSDATMAYQGYAGKQDLKTLAAIDAYATGGLKPDLTILLDIDTKAGLARAARKYSNSRSDRMERKSAAYHKAVRNGYLAIARADKKRIKVIDATADIRAIQQSIRREVERVI